MELPNAQTVFHEISHHSQWPVPVHSVSNLLTRPLPAELAYVDSDSLSSSSAELLHEALKGYTVSADAELLLSRSSKYVLGTVLAIVSAMRRLCLCSSGENLGSRITMHLWVLLLRALGRGCAEGAIILDDVPFILPRMGDLMPFEESPLDGRAILLVSHLVHGNREVPSSNNSSSSDENKDEDESEASHSESSCSSIRKIIDVPFDGHVIPGSGMRSYALLPVVCVADEINIGRLMTSVLYQRRVWGIDGPAVGVFFSPTGTKGTIVLGWLETESNGVDQLPNAHISLANDTTDFSIGTFDLLNPKSALLFAQFVLNLSTHYQAIADQSLDPQINEMCWRIDHRMAIDHPDCNTSSEIEWQSTIERWRQDVHVHIPFIATRHCALDPESAILKSTDKLPKSKSEETTATSQSGRNLEASSINKSKSKSPGVTSTSAKSHESKSRFSCSEKSAFNFEVDKATNQSWRLDRFAIPIITMELSGIGGEIVNGKIKEYQEMTKPFWDDEWDKTLLNSDPVYKHEIDLLRLQKGHLPQGFISTAKKTETNEDNRQLPSNIPEPNAESQLNARISEIIRERSHILLAICSGAFTRAAIEKLKIPMFEAEMRHSWDAMLYNFFLDLHESSSPQILLEHEIYLSRNSGLDYKSKEDIFETKEYVHISTPYQYYVGDLSNLPKTTRALLRDVRAASVTEMAQCINVLNEPTYQSKMEHRAMQEPDKGKADAIAFVPVKISDPNLRIIFYSQHALENIARSEAADRNATTQSTVKAPNISTDKLSMAKRNVFQDLGKYSVKADLPVPDNRNFKVFPFEFDVNTLLAPVLFAEYQKHDESEMKARNQGRMYCISGVKFLAHIGVMDYPVYSLVINGSVGALMMAWHCKEDRRIFVIEKNMRTFDLAQPIDAFQFAIFLIRLKSKSDELIQLVEVGLKKADSDLSRQGPHWWTADAQKKELEGKKSS